MERNTSKQYVLSHNKFHWQFFSKRAVLTGLSRTSISKYADPVRVISTGILALTLF